MSFDQSFSVFLIIVTILGSNLVLSEIYLKNEAPHVTLVNDAVLSGSLESSREGRPFSSFVGIPFATIPDRFEEAQLIKGGGWKDSVFKAVTPGPICPQMGSGDESQCLNLNVYVPMNDTGVEGGYPVMLWIHGGAFLFGGGYAYNPKFFMDEDLILVTINYRLGIFGFLSTGDSVVPGNNGLKDQVLALCWVQENIKNFGGDPGKVTIFGESAGSVSVHYLLLSSTTRGLFRGAISQSGTALAAWAYQPNPKDVAVKMATHLKCPASGGDSSKITSEEIVTCLKATPAEKLLEAQFVFKNTWPSSIAPFSFVPVKEPDTSSSAFLTKSPWDIVLDKTAPLPEIPWVLGANEDEGSTLYAGIVLNSQSLLDELDANWTSIAPTAFEFDQFLKPTPNEKEIVTEKLRKLNFGQKAISTDTRINLTNAYSDGYFLYSVYKAAIETASRGTKHPVYLYHYTHRGPGSLLKLMGLQLAEEETKKVGHGDELLLQFHDMPPGTKSLVQPDSLHEEFSKNFVKLWASFAIHGEPKHSWGTSTNPRWKPISKEEVDGSQPLKWYQIDSDISFVDDLHKGRMQFCDKLWMQHLAPINLSKHSTDKTEL